MSIGMNHAAHAHWRVYGIDSETYEGEPISFQLFGENVDIITQPRPKKALEDFLALLDSLPLAHGYKATVVFCHNLEFDMVSFFYNHLEALRDEEIELELNGWRISGVYANVKFCTFRKGRHTFHLIDTYAYFQTSLAKLAQIFCPHLPKLPHLDGLGHKRFKITDKKFRAYAMRDAEIAYIVGLSITEYHRLYSVRLCVSAPHFAARVFRHAFLKRDIPLPPKAVLYASLHSYHGGKNNITKPAGLYRNVKSLDIVSAYPAAMRELPSFSVQRAYKKLLLKKGCRRVPDLGVYRITAKIKNCPWPSLYSHNFKPLKTYCENTWITGYELNEALRMGECVIQSGEGHYYDTDLDGHDSPLAGYVDEFFNLKNTATSKSESLYYKLLLNSLYGKFIQSRKESSLELISVNVDDQSTNTERVLVAGGLFHPFIATLITGRVRAWIHALEHEYQAIHTATDSVFTQRKIPKILPDGLGGLKLECTGELLLIRNKCYIFYSKDATETSIPSTIFKDRHIIKYARHGFHGTLADLERIYQTGDTAYEYEKCNKLKESLKRDLKVNAFEIRKSSLNF